MALNKVKPGNMYQHVTHTHNHLAGECPHKCAYCSTQLMARRFQPLKERYTGPCRILDDELDVKYGTGKVIFLENCSDLFAGDVAGYWIIEILQHAKNFPTNTYIIQTKNPSRIPLYFFLFPTRFLVGTTAESHFVDPSVSQAPPVEERLKAIGLLKCPSEKKFVTIEPIMKFSLKRFYPMLLMADAGTYFVGADSKGSGLLEPSAKEIAALVEGLREAGKKVVLKSNLKRIYSGD